MWRPRKWIVAKIVIVAWVFALAGCDETRFVGVNTQKDTFVQDGETVVQVFTQEGTQQIDALEQTGFFQVDFFKQKASAQVDILWVVDNSGSMFQEQTNLANNFDSFIAFIDESQIDYHIGVISTDMDQATHSGKLQGSPKVISRDTPDPRAAFAANIQVGTTGGGYEMGLLSAHEALSEPLISGDNAGFLRDEGSIAVIFVSDEDDNSYGQIDYFTRFFSSIKNVGNENNVIVAAIVGDDPDGCEGNDGRAFFGERYHQLVTTLGGTTASICASDFGSTLEQLGLTVASLSRRFELSREPDQETIQVLVDIDGDGPGDFEDIPRLDGTIENWRYVPVENALYFQNYVPPPDAHIHVEYSNTEDVFYLTGRGDPSTMVVKVDDVEVPQSDGCWQYHSVENAVVFYGECIPELQSQVEVSYSDLLRSFQLSTSVENPDTLKVEEDPHDGLGWRVIFEDPATGWMYHVESNSILFQGSHVPELDADVKISFSNLYWIFHLSLVPQESTLQVTLDEDGDGPGEPAIREPFDEVSNPEGWIYYGPNEAGDHANSISFEKAASPPARGSVITATYTPGS